MADHKVPPPADDEGALLVERWQKARGDEREEILLTLFQRYYPTVFRFFSTRGFAPLDSEDLAQETFLRIYVNLQRYRSEARFETYLFRIATNLFKNNLRARAAAKRSGLEVDLDEVHGLSSSPDAYGAASADKLPLDELLDRERAKVLHDAIETLPAQMLRCVLLRVGSGLRYREIADVMQISIDTVKAHLFQARQKLKSELGDYFTDVDI